MQYDKMSDPESNYEFDYMINVDFWFEIFLIALSIIFHEIGHYIFIDNLGIFKGFEMRLFGVEVMVSQDDEDLTRGPTILDFFMIYWSGFIFGYFPFLWWQLAGFPAVWFSFLCLIGAGADIYYFFKGVIYLFRTGIIDVK